ncbi:MAG TPA: EEP domain-containing protein [Gammaproteobacteria bacterium]|nr:EEP domain-containing protein [Gammaproteobacteria bacterium]
MSYNIQVGIATSRASHYVTGSWKHILPSAQRLPNLDRAARLIQQYDIVGLQELDAGSLRSNFINLAEYLAERADFPYWYHQVNRNLGQLAQHSNAFLSHFKPDRIENLKLPGIIPGRQAIMAVFESETDALAVFILHLALGRRARIRQLGYIAERVSDYPHAIVMGDLNCRDDSREMQLLFRKTRLREPSDKMCTFPSWCPQHHIDHILVSADLTVKNACALRHEVSDHLPLTMEIELPPTIQLNRDTHQSLSLENYLGRSIISR